MLKLNELHFTRPLPLDKDGVLTAQSLGKDLSDEEQMLAEYIGGLDCYPEAHASQHARDMKLGVVNDLVEFVPTSWADAEIAGFEISGVAIGPGPGEQGFNLIASLILPEVLAKARKYGYGDGWSATIIIDRVQCSVRFDTDGLRISGAPLYGRGFDDRVKRILEWLEHAVSARL